MARSQRTVEREGAVRGYALHSGAEVEVRVRPAPADAGVVFVRTDLPGAPRIPADFAHIAVGEHRTTLRADAPPKGGAASSPAASPATIDTVEHLLACLMGLSIDNLVVEVSGPEMPGLDGSAKEFVELLDSLGVVEQGVPRRTIAVDGAAEVSWDREDKGFFLAPAGMSGDSLRLSYTYAAPGHVQYAAFALRDADHFRREIAPARTFVHEAHIEAARARGEGKGASDENTVVLLPGGGTKTPQRFENECARHKLVDLMGDLFLAGADVLGTVRAHRTGHRENARLVERLRAVSSALDPVAALGSGPPARRAPTLDHAQIRRILPHRYPMLLVDRVVDIEGFRRAVGIKNVTLNEPYFIGHYPEQPIMPGVLVVEAMAQLAGLLLLRKFEIAGRLPVVLSIDRVKFRRAVVPGDQLRLEAETVRLQTGRGRVQCRALVAGALAAEARLNFALTEESRG